MKIITFIFLLICSIGYSQNTLQGIVNINNELQSIGLNYQNKTKWISFNMAGVADKKAQGYFEVKVLLHKEWKNWNFAFTPVPMLSLRWSPNPETKIYTAKKKTPIEIQLERKILNNGYLGINYRVFNYPTIQYRHTIIK